MDLYEQYALVAAMEAVKDSGMDLETIDKDNIGVVLGVASVVFTPSKNKSANTHAPTKKRALALAPSSSPR